MRSASGTMMTREEALKKKNLAALTTDLKGAKGADLKGSK